MISEILSAKYKLFNIMHNYPVDIWILWSILILTIFAIIIKLYANLTDESGIQQFIMRL